MMAGVLFTMQGQTKASISGRLMRRRHVGGPLKAEMYGGRSMIYFG